VNHAIYTARDRRSTTVPRHQQELIKNRCVSILQSAKDYFELSFGCKTADSETRIVSVVDGADTRKISLNLPFARWSVNGCGLVYRFKLWLHLRLPYHSGKVVS